MYFALDEIPPDTNRMPRRVLHAVPNPLKWKFLIISVVMNEYRSSLFYWKGNFSIRQVSFVCSVVIHTLSLLSQSVHCLLNQNCHVACWITNSYGHKFLKECPNSAYMALNSRAALEGASVLDLPHSYGWGSWLPFQVWWQKALAASWDSHCLLWFNFWKLFWLSSKLMNSNKLFVVLTMLGKVCVLWWIPCTNLCHTLQYMFEQ